MPLFPTVASCFVFFFDCLAVFGHIWPPVTIPSTCSLYKNMLGCLDTCYYVAIGAVLLIMVLFNVRCSFLQNGFHSLLRYDLRVDMFVNDNETEPAEAQHGWSSLMERRAENDVTESDKEMASEPEAKTSASRGRSKSFTKSRSQEESSDDDGGGGSCSGPGGGGSGPGGGPSPSRRSFGSRGGGRRDESCQKKYLKKRNNMVFRRCDLNCDDDLPSSCVQLITNNLVELVNEESFLAQCESVALMDDVLRLNKSLQFDKILGDFSTE